MSDFARNLPRERLDALNGWKGLRTPLPQDAFLPEGEVLHLASAHADGDGGDLVFAKPIPDADPAGSWGGCSLPRGVAVSDVGDLYLADPDYGRVLYTRASLPPKAMAGSPVAPFVPLWSFALQQPDDHPLALVKPVDLCLIPPMAQIGAFADTLLVADAGRDLLIWIDRRQIVTRHSLALPSAPISVAATRNGRVAVLLAGQVVVVTNGRILASLTCDVTAHTIVALTNGTFAVVGKTLTQCVTVSNQIVALTESHANVITPALGFKGNVLRLLGSCATMTALDYPNVAIDRFGALEGTNLMVSTRPKRLPRPRSGRWISQKFDGGARGFAWDRVALDLSLPAQCRVLVFGYVSDIDHDAAEIETVATWSDPTVLDRGTPPEFLIQRNKGRYLWLRIEAFGDGTATPEIHGIDLFGPRDSQVNLLPAPFHQDPVSTDFLDRFLSVQDAFLGEALLIFRRVGVILQPDATPDEFVDWLGSWFDWRFLSHWDKATRRDMIGTAMQFFKERGTVAGLERLLQWHTGLGRGAVSVLEDFRLAEGGASEVWIGAKSVSLSDRGAHQFTVVVPKSVIPDAAARSRLHRLIDAQKPAHTLARLIVVEPGVVLGRQARLGVDATLPDSRPAPLNVGRLDQDLLTVATC